MPHPSLVDSMIRRRSPGPKWFMGVTEAIDKAWGWHRLPLPLALAVLEGIRMRMRQQNLYDPATPAYDQQMQPAVPTDDRYLTRRTADGTFNDLHDPAMGSVEMRFGRNVPLAQTYPSAGADLLEPNPRTISNELLARGAVIPATTLNLTAAARLQVMVPDWLSHGQNPKERRWEIPVAANDPGPERAMTILRTRTHP